MKNKIGVTIPEILFPNKKTKLEKWSVVACDQYTSEPEYWEKVKKFVGDSNSTLNIIFPEVYLELPNKEKRISEIKQKMKEYLEKEVLVPEKCLVLVDRQTSHTKSRKGLILAIDLENYDYKKGSQTLIRATEGTVLDRLPPRVAIRKHALIESPHIMVLLDDPKKTVIEPLFKKIKKFEKIYDFKLMMKGGNIKGYKIKDENIWKQVIENLEKLADKESFNRKYGLKNKRPLLFAMGDGNHSLATAKATWEMTKGGLSKNEQKNHPSRYALIELLNIHDAGITFEPIHRVVFNVKPEEVLEEFYKFSKKQKSIFSVEFFKSKKELDSKIKKTPKKENHIIGFVFGKNFGLIKVGKPKFNIEAGTLQSFLDYYLLRKKEAKIDYIHGEDTVTKFGKKNSNIGFYLPAMDKHDFFKTVIVDGTLPRKTFSLGEAEEKRFYLECRKIK